MAKRKGKSRFMIEAEYLSFRLGVFLIRALPLKAAFALASGLGRVLFAVDRRHRERAVLHLMHAGVAKDRAGAVEIARKSFIHLAKVGVETFKLDQYITAENFHEHAIWREEPTGKTRAALVSPKGTIIVGAHFGNWEIGGLACAAMTRPLLTVMRPLDNPKISAHVTSMRSLFRQEVCQKEGALKRLLGRLKAHGSVAMLSDQHAGRADGVETVFFGHPARTHAAPALLHFRTGIPIIMGVSKRLDDELHYEMITFGPYEVEPSGDKLADIQRLTQAFTSDLEKAILEAPEQWVWPHRRWLDLREGWLKERGAAQADGGVRAGG